MDFGRDSSSIFDFNDYKKAVNHWIQNQTRGGHGQLRRMAQHLRVNSVVMSQVFRGSRDLTLEQALGVAEYMGLREHERDFFLLLVQNSRAGSHGLRRVFQKQIQKTQEDAQALKNRVEHQTFDEAQKARFYSHWSYSAVRLGLSVPALQSPDGIARHLGLSRSTVADVMEFLLRHRLIQEDDGKFFLGPQVTHVGHDSPWVNRHHTNWRLQGIRALDQTSDKDLFYTGPMSLSQQASEQIRKLLIGLIEKATKIAVDSDSQDLRCLNLDWFSIGDRGRLR